jgi:hypothetical protein
MSPRVVVAAPIVLVLGTAVLAGCSSKSGGSVASPTSTAPSGSASGTPSTSASASPPAGLPGTCQDMLPLLDLDQALGVPLIGQTIYIKGVASPKIKRTGRVTCRYGVGKVGNKTGPAKLEVGVSTYTDETAAQDRVQATVVELRGEGSAPSQVQVNGQPATVLIGRGPATLVLATGTRTIVISLAPRVIQHGNETPKALTAVAELAVKNLPS